MSEINDDDLALGAKGPSYDVGEGDDQRANPEILTALYDRPRAETARERREYHGPTIDDLKRYPLPIINRIKAWKVRPEICQQIVHAISDVRQILVHGYHLRLTHADDYRLNHIAQHLAQHMQRENIRHQDIRAEMLDMYLFDTFEIEPSDITARIRSEVADVLALEYGPDNVQCKSVSVHVRRKEGEDFKFVNIEEEARKYPDLPTLQRLRILHEKGEETRP